jgi:hypothetical protein
MLKIPLLKFFLLDKLIAPVDESIEMNSVLSISIPETTSKPL